MVLLMLPDCVIVVTNPEGMTRSDRVVIEYIPDDGMAHESEFRPLITLCDCVFIDFLTS